MNKFVYLRSSNGVLEELALGARARVHPDWSGRHGKGRDELLVKELFRV